MNWCKYEIFVESLKAVTFVSCMQNCTLICSMAGLKFIRGVTFLLKVVIPHPPVYCQSMYTHVLLNQNKFSLSKSQMLTHINAYIWLIISKFHTCALHCYKSTSVCTINLCKLRRGVPSYAYLAVVVCQFKKRSCQCIFVVVSTKLLHSTACHVMYTILICVCFVYM